MGKVDYSLKKILHEINKIHHKTHKSRISILSDIKECKKKYQSDYKDYFLFAMYELNNNERKTIITNGINNEIINKCNDLEYEKYFSNKILFNKKFHKYLHRDWLEIKEDNYEEYKAFIKKHSTITMKSSVSKETIKVNKKNLRSTYDNILKNKVLLIEEQPTQLEIMKKLNPKSINPIKIITIGNQIMAAYLIIDDLIAPINIDTGIIDYLAADKDNNLYERHPITNESIIWFQIPKWNRVLRLIDLITKEIPQVKYVSWDICISDIGPMLIEATCLPKHDIYQLPGHRTNGIGLYPKFKEAMEKENII